MSVQDRASSARGDDSPADGVLDRAPHRIGRVAIRVRDLDRVGLFYRETLSLDVVSERPGSLQLGAGAAVLLELREDRSARPRTPRDAGLFHTAFLLPSRGDLAAWVAFAAGRGTRIEGASNHLVSEAIYLSDPEGNGIEIYADRPRSTWPGKHGAVEMATHRLDFDDLSRAGEGRSWSGFPAGGTIGHVHLQVGELAPADAFYSGLLGFEIMSRYPGASFYGSGGYHHQLAANIWNSRGAPARPEDAAGLEDVEVLVEPQAFSAIRSRLPPEIQGSADDSGVALRDPWGTALTIVRR